MKKRHVEGREDVHMFRQVEGIGGGIRPGLDNTVRTVIAYHKFCDTMITTLHVVAVLMEGAQQHVVTNHVGNFW